MRGEERTDLISHLSELRARLLRTLLYIVLAATFVSFFFNPLYRLLVGPILAGVKDAGGFMTMRGVMEGLVLRLWVILLGGLVIAMPFIYLEVWGFIRPGLTRHERRVVAPLAPVSGILFLFGVAMAYAITRPSVAWLLALRPPETQLYLTLTDTIILFLKFYIAFGLGFQLPIVMVILAALHIVSSRFLIRYWREATVVIFILAAIITPTWDPLTMTVAALPMVLLYLGTIGFIKIMERRRQKHLAAELEQTTPSEP